MAMTGNNGQDELGRGAYRPPALRRARLFHAVRTIPMLLDFEWP